ncbi:MAG TPA: protoglobin domain-containing protein [Gemmatimonadaceae bacterium]|nr:protoglobin domain-containing protein [Gemmatimonadaceae bacterium]
MTATHIPGYTARSSDIARSPVTMAELELMKRTALFSDGDVRMLKLSRGILEDQVEAILDVWYGFVASQPHLLASFSDGGGRPIADYLSAVRKRFGQWILDTADAEYDQSWLDYQHEIGLRHHRTKKNLTDGVHAADIIPFRYLLPLAFTITHTLEPFLAQKGHSAEQVSAMHDAWMKSVQLQITLWSYPYVRDGDF